MIQKITTGRGFRGVLNYVLREGKGHEHEEARIIDSNMEGENARDLAAEFGAFRGQRPDLERAVHHASLRLPDDEHLTPEQWGEVARDYLEGMGFERTAYVVVDHDEEHNHIHIVASRINEDGQVISDSHERYRSQEVVYEIEEKYNLRHAVDREQERDQEREPRIEISQTEKEMSDRVGEIPPKIFIAKSINEAIDRSDGSREDFTRKLDDLGVTAHWNESKTTDRISGASYELRNYEGEMANRVQGRQIGPDYSWTNLQERLQERAREVEQERAHERERAHELEQERREQERTHERERERAREQERERSRPEPTQERSREPQKEERDRAIAQKEEERSRPGPAQGFNRAAQKEERDITKAMKEPDDQRAPAKKEREQDHDWDR